MSGPDAGAELLETSTGVELLEAATAGVDLLGAAVEVLAATPATAGIGTCLRVAVVDRRSMKPVSTSCARMIWQGLLTATSCSMCCRNLLAE